MRLAKAATDYQNDLLSLSEVRIGRGSPLWMILLANCNNLRTIFLKIKLQQPFGYWTAVLTNSSTMETKHQEHVESKYTTYAGTK